MSANITRRIYIDQIQTQLAESKKWEDLTRPTQYLPSNDPNLNIANPYEPTTAPPPPSESYEKSPNLPPEDAIIEANGINVNFTRLYTSFQNGYNRFMRSLQTNALRANRRIGGIPTPGGIWVPVGLLLFSFLILIQVNGKTRINWLWNVLLGAAALSSSENWVIAKSATEQSGNNSDTISNNNSTFLLSSTTNNVLQNIGPSDNEPVLPSFTPLPYYQQPGNNYMLSTMINEGI